MTSHLAAAPDRADKPNVVLIVSDDMGWGDVGFHGVDTIMTPNIDSIAANGVHYSQGYVTASVCGPSRSGMLTGVYQQRFGSGENPSVKGFPGNQPEHLINAGVTPDQSLVSEILKPHGYKTGIIGKWHLGVNEPVRPQARGFDYFFGFLNGAHDFTQWTDSYERPSTWPLWRNEEALPARKDVYLTDLFSDEAVGFIERNSEDPFFLYLAYNSVHAPWQVPDEYLERTKSLDVPYDRQFFAAMTLAMDDGIGRVLEALKKQGVHDNTMVIFIADNGTPAGQGIGKNKTKKDPSRERGGMVMSNAGPFRGYKGDTYEGGIRVPFTMQFPGKIKAGSRYNYPMSSLNIVPTIASFVGIDKPLKGFPFDGKNLLPYINGEKGDERPHQTLFWRRDNDYAIRHGDMKLTWNDSSGSLDIMLFDIANDPEERKDLASQMPEQAQTLQDMFDAWDSTMPDNKWWGGPGNRNREYAQGKRTSVQEFNANPNKRRPGKVR